MMAEFLSQPDRPSLILLVPDPESQPAPSGGGDLDEEQGRLDLAIVLDRERPDPYLKRGRFYCDRGKWDKALADFTRAVQLDPDDTEALQQRGRAWVGKGDWEQALRDYTAALQVDLDQAVLAMSNGLDLASRGQIEPATTAGDRARHFQERLIGTYFLRGDAHLQRGDFAEAVADFTQVLRIAPANATAYTRRGEAHRLRGDLERAVADVGEALRLAPESTPSHLARAVAWIHLGEYDRAIDDFTEILRDDPNDPNALHQRGHAHLKRGDRERGIEDFTAALRIFSSRSVGTALVPVRKPVRSAKVTLPSVGDVCPENHEEEPSDGEIDPTPIEDLCRRGAEHLQGGQIDRAIAAFTEAIEFDPENADAYSGRGKAYRAKGKGRKAIADFTRGVQFAPQVAENWHWRGQIYAQIGQPNRAIADYTEALRLDPSFVAAYISRALIHARRNDFAEAIADASEAIRLDPEAARAYFIRGVAHSGQGNHDVAIADFDEVLRLDPNDAVALNDRGLALASKGDHDRAIADYTEALRIAPNLTLARCNRAIAYRMSGDHAQAVADLTATLRAEPRNALAHHQRGLALAASGDLDGAASDFALACDIDPEFAEPRTCLARLAKVRAQRLELAPPESEPAVEVEVEQKAIEAEPTIAEKEEATQPTPVRAEVESPSLQLECPGCGEAGLFKLDRLDKLVFCRGCDTWYRTNNLGRLAKVPPPAGPAGTWVEVSKPGGGWTKNFVPHSAKARPARETRTGGRAKSTRRLVLGTLIATGIGAIIASFLFFRTDSLTSRTKALARAWLASDEAGMRKFTDPVAEQDLPRWLHHNPPPELGASGRNPWITVAVERNDGKTAEVRLGVDAGSAEFLPVAIFQRWVEKGGRWYFSPEPGDPSPLHRTGSRPVGGRVRSRVHRNEGGTEIP